MPIPENLLPTALAVMPHTDVDQALKTTLSMGIPFWPQLPNLAEAGGDDCCEIQIQDIEFSSKRY